MSELILQDLDLKSTILDIIDLHRPTAVNKGIVIKKELQDMPKKTVDKHKIEQILSNLLSNALKFTLEGGSIFVKLHEAAGEEGAIDLTVKDSGMGLELVKKFTNLHGGRVNIDSTEGEGTTFTVRLYDQKANVVSS
jgi:signal transduction histidine kinase